MKGFARAILLPALALLLAPLPATAQQPAESDGMTETRRVLPQPTIVVGGPGSANYRLAARFAPYKLDDLLHSTSVQPRWIEGSERFWYESRRATARHT